jgi:hypothetical protein
MSQSHFEDCPKCGNENHLFVIFRFHTNTQLVSVTSHCRSCRYDDVKYENRFTEEYYMQLNLPETGFESIKNECLVDVKEISTGKKVTLICQRNPITDTVFFTRALSDFGALNDLRRTKELYQFISETTEINEF